MRKKNLPLLVYLSLFFPTLSSCGLIFYNEPAPEKEEPKEETINDDNVEPEPEPEPIHVEPEPEIDPEDLTNNELYKYKKINAEFTKYEIVTRFLAYSDNHIVDNATDPRTQRMINTIRQINNMVKDDNLNDGYNRLDAIVDVGDLIGDGSSLTRIQSCLRKGKSIYDSNKLSETQLVITTGNHEYDNNINLTDSAFNSIFGQNPTNDVKINGYHFITIKCDGTTDRTNIRTDGWVKGWEYSDSTVAEATQLIQNAYNDTGPDKPIFVAMHIGNLDTVIGTDSYVDKSDLTATTKFNDIFANYSNLVVFSGHSHFNTVDDCAIHQKNFTSINTGCNSYTMRSYNGYWEYKNGEPNELATNRVPMFNYFHDNYNQIPVSLDDETRVSGVYENYEDRTYVCGCQIVEINSMNQIRVRPWNVMNNKFTRKSWVIDSFDKTKFKYTPERFKEEDFFFDKNAEIKIDKCLNNTVNVKVPKIGPYSIDGRVYKVKLFDENDNCIFQRNISTDYYNERFEYPLSFYFNDMVENKKYKVTAQAFNSLYASNLIDSKTLSSNILSKTFIYKDDTTIDELDADIVDFDIDAENKKLIRTNKYGLDPYVIGYPKMYHDNEINMDVIETSGDNTGLACLENYYYLTSKFTSSFTFEAYLKIKSTTVNGALISSKDTGGFGLEYKDGSIRFGLHNGTSFVINSFSSILPDTWYHIAFVYDSSTYTAYINGVQKNSFYHSTFKQIPAGLSKLNTQMYIGCDVTSTNKERNFGESFTSFTLAKFRMYSNPLSETTISSLYKSIVS